MNRRALIVICLAVAIVLVMVVSAVAYPMASVRKAHPNYPKAYLQEYGSGYGQGVYWGDNYMSGYSTIDFVGTDRTLSSVVLPNPTITIIRASTAPAVPEYVPVTDEFGDLVGAVVTARPNALLFPLEPWLLGYNYYPAEGKSYRGVTIAEAISWIAEDYPEAANKYIPTYDPLLCEVAYRDRNVAGGIGRTALDPTSLQLIAANGPVEVSYKFICREDGVPIGAKVYYSNLDPATGLFFQLY